jgi:hypothetical protein
LKKGIGRHLAKGARRSSGLGFKSSLDNKGYQGWKIYFLMLSHANAWKVLSKGLSASGFWLEPAPRALGLPALS